VIETHVPIESALAPGKTETTFKSWLRRLVTGAAELQAFDAGEIDAVMDRDSGCAHLLPEAQDALRDSSRIARSALEAGGVVENQLLAALPSGDYARMEGDLESVALKCGQVLYEPGERMRHVYFPRDCVVSLLTPVEGHRVLEVGLVGREGMIGARLVLGTDKSSVRALVQGTGTALRMSSERFLREFRRSQALHRAMLQFTDRLMVQVSQTAACNRFHVVDARLARWLLMTAERARATTFHLTHSIIASMLGVRREGVTVAAVGLQRRGIIRYSRGKITILDQAGLAAAACSCYRHLQLMGA
jgi:CRP-like cAMP-binding protein